MSPTLDETATTRDARVTRHMERSALLIAIGQAIEFDGLPAPMELQFSRLSLRFEENGTADLDDWAAYIGVTAADKPTIHTSGGHPWRSYEAHGTFAGHAVELWCAHPLSSDEAAAYRAAS